MSFAEFISPANQLLHWKPIEVNIGGLPLGGPYPVRIQSMTNTNTMDTIATVNQCLRLIEAGCEYIRITAQNTKEAENLDLIKRELRKNGFQTPLIADIHFNPAVAMVAARLVEKVRINPGNYTDKRELLKSPHTSNEYDTELEKIAERIYPLLRICKEYGTAIRIGTNHGSLSGRILSRYGDTPLGMAESAMEFVRICCESGFYNLVLSMKSSNLKVMIAATRLLVEKMITEQRMFPLHIGVTEAGNGLDGRIKSSAGIGTLLAVGIGDTIRVSLTESPENEIPVARQIISLFPKVNSSREASVGNKLIIQQQGKYFDRRISRPVGQIGQGQVPVVITGGETLYSIDENFKPERNYGKRLSFADIYNLPKTGETVFLFLDPTTEKFDENKLKVLQSYQNVVLVYEVTTKESVTLIHNQIQHLDLLGIDLPFIVSFHQVEPSSDVFAVHTATILAPLLVEGLCDGIYLQNSLLTINAVVDIAFKLLQATRARITQTEYIACPGCGRTRYDLEGTLEKVKHATSHLKGLKIAVMGCIVNGPGEMADADYGYVGQGNGKVSIYKGKVAIFTNIPEDEAISMLIQLMQEQGHWQDP